MDTWLEALKTEGDARLVDSGHFELNFEDAFRKLGASRNALPAFFVLKALQALVAVQATRVDIRISSKVVEVNACLGPRRVDFESLCPLTVSQLLGADELPERHLAVAICSALAQPGAQVSLRQGTLKLEYSGLNPLPTTSSTEEEMAGFGFTLTRSPILSKAQKLECRVVRERCSFAPIEVVVNDAEVHSQDWDLRHRHLLEVYWAGPAGPGALAGVRWDGVADATGNWWPAPDPDSWQVVQKSALTWLRQSRGEKSEAGWTVSGSAGRRLATPGSAILAVRAEAADPCVGLVKWGVLLDLVPWRINLLGATFIAACSQVETDLSEMKVRHIPGLAVDLSEVMDCLTGLDLNQEVSLRAWCYTHHPRSRRVVIGISVCAGVMGLAASMWLVGGMQMLVVHTHWTGPKRAARRLLKRFQLFKAHPTSGSAAEHSRALQAQVDTLLHFY